MRAVGYLRVSTDDQKLGPEAQRASIEAWAAREGISIVAWREEHVSGGADVEDRPALLEAVEALREHSAGVLAVAKRDRMARSVAKAQEIAGEDGLVSSAGAVVRSADGMSDHAVGSPEGIMSTGMADVFAAYERALIRTRTKAALAVKRKRGEAVGPPPYGFQVGPGGRLELNPKEVRVVLAIARLKRADATERAIVEELDAAGLRSRKGTPLSQTQVHRIIARLHWDGDKVRIDR